MKCEDFEQFMASALGNELAVGDRPAFENHLTHCERCRLEYESLQSSLETMKMLSAPLQKVADPELEQRLKGLRPQAMNRPRHFHRLRGLRYAAGILVAFTCGYAFHAVLLLSNPSSSQLPTPPLPGIVHNDEGSKSFQAAFAGTHRQDPRRTDLAKCMIAMFGAKGN